MAHCAANPFDDMFTALVGWDFNSLAEFCRADYEDMVEDK